MSISIIGVDCATDPKKVGLSLGKYDGDNLVISEARKAGPTESIPEIIFNWTLGAEAVLLSIDAPLGWPISLGKSLVHHEAGDVISVATNQLFRRETDRVVKAVIGKQSLDVGADRIARTAVAALGVMDVVRLLIKEPIPLAWEVPLIDFISAIEVYPAATLSVYKLQSSGYKKSAQTIERSYIIDGLREHVKFEMDVSSLKADDDILDAVVCVLAGADYLSGKTIQPTNKALAKKEGWIWVRDPESLL